MSYRRHIELSPPPTSLLITVAFRVSYACNSLHYLDSALTRQHTDPNLRCPRVTHIFREGDRLLSDA